jgi:hypothetical protein
MSLKEHNERVIRLLSAMSKIVSVETAIEWMLARSAVLEARPIDLVDQPEKYESLVGYVEALNDEGGLS